MCFQSKSELNPKVHIRLPLGSKNFSSKSSYKELNYCLLEVWNDCCLAVDDRIDSFLDNLVSMQPINVTSCTRNLYFEYG